MAGYKLVRRAKSISRGSGVAQYTLRNQYILKSCLKTSQEQVESLDTKVTEGTLWLVFTSDLGEPIVKVLFLQVQTGIAFTGSCPAGVVNHCCIWKRSTASCRRLVECIMDNFTRQSFHVRHKMIQDSQQSLTKGKSCLTSLVVFYNGVTLAANRGRCHLSGLL